MIYKGVYTVDSWLNGMRLEDASTHDEHQSSDPRPVKICLDQ